MFKKNTLGYAFMHSLSKYIKKTIKKIAMGQDPDELSKMSPNIASRHMIKLPDRSKISSFSNTPLSSDDNTSSDESSYSMNSNGKGGSVIHLTSKPRHKKTGHLRHTEAQTDIQGEVK